MSGKKRTFKEISKAKPEADEKPDKKKNGHDKKEKKKDIKSKSKKNEKKGKANGKKAAKKKRADSDSEFSESEFSDSEDDYSLSSVFDESSDELDLDGDDLVDDESEEPKEVKKRRKVEESSAAKASQISVRSDKRLITTRASAVRNSAVKAPADEVKESNRVASALTGLKIENKGASGTVDEIGNCLEGLTIVCSGVFENISREKIEEFINVHGGKCTGSVSGRTSYLITGYKLEDGREIS